MSGWGDDEWQAKPNAAELRRLAAQQRRDTEPDVDWEPGFSVGAAALFAGVMLAVILFIGWAVGGR